MSCTRDTVSRLSTVRVSRDTSVINSDAYSDTFSDERKRPRASVSLTRRILESGVFNSCVTAETKSDFIVARIAAERAARAVSRRAMTAAAAANEINMNVRLAPLAAAKTDSSGAAWDRAVQD